MDVVAVRSSKSIKLQEFNREITVEKILGASLKT